MKSLIKILWIDDKHETQPRLLGAAKKLGLHLVVGKSPESVELLRKNYWDYSAVLLDVNILESENSELSPSAANGAKAIKQINDIKEKKFPIVIYSGVKGTLDGSDKFKLYNKDYEIFDKNDRDGYKNCLLRLKELAENQLEYQIIKENKDFFNIPKDIIAEKCLKQVLTILLDKTPDYRNYLTGLRKVLDDGVFPSLKHHKMMPPINGLTAPSKFMSGQIVNNFELIEEPPEKIKHILRFLIKDFTNPSSHTFTYSEDNKHLVKGLCYLTMDVCIWLANYIPKGKKYNWKEYSNNGIITNKNDKRSFGFLKSEDFKDGLVFYYSDLKHIHPNDLNERDEITFNVTKKPSFKDGVVKYKYNAIDIKFGK